MELLSPAGSLDAVKAAVSNGADAIYVGTKFFNARRLAQNFTDETLRKTLLYCKLHGVRVYMTCNTLVRNEEFKLWFEQIRKAYLMGIDAIILQDIALAPYVQAFFPGLEIHASTQASFMNYHGINAFPNFDLYVLARELSKDEMVLVRKKVNKKLEVFIHGHLCVSYSGQCLISSLIGSRSGNRGVCASSCRKKYNNEGYLISPRDLMMGNQIDQLLDLGIDSVKVEGRMKSPEYVAISTRVYRKQIDDANRHRMKRLTQKQVTNLKLGFNRDFTPGFFSQDYIVDPEMPMNRGIPLGTVKSGVLTLEHDIELHDGVSFWQGRGTLEGGSVTALYKRGKSVSSARKGDSITLPFKQFKNGVKVFLTSQNEGQPVFGRNRQSLDLQVTGRVDEPLVITCRQEGKELFRVESSIPLQKAKNQMLNKETIYKKFSEIIPVDIDFQAPDVFMPMTRLNEMVKAFTESCSQSLLPQRKNNDIVLPEFKERVPKKTQLIVKVYSLDQLKEATDADVIYYDVFAKDVMEAKKLCKGKFFLDTPVVVSDKQILDIKQIIKRVQPDGIVIGNWGLLGIEFSGEKHGKYSLNTFNDASMQMLLDRGVIPMFSVELSYRQLCKFTIKEGIYYAHGRIPVMHFKGEYQEAFLKDEKGYRFPLRTVGGNTEMLYSRPIATLERIKDLEMQGIKYYFLDLEVKTKTIIDAYKNIIAGVKQDISYLKKGTTIKNFDKGVA